MGEPPFIPPAGEPRDDRRPAQGAEGAPLEGGIGAPGDSQEVFDKLDALLGRLHGPDSSAENPLASPEIPTLDQPVTWTSPEAGPVALPAGRHIPTLTEPVELRAAKDAGISRQALRERVESLLDPTLEDRLCERTMADLDRTLIDVERGFRDEIAAWRDDQEARIRDQVRGEIERAVDEIVAGLARENDAGRR